MVELTLFGWFIAVLSSAASVALVVVALSAAAFVGFSVLSSLASPRDKRLFMGAAIAGAGLVFVVSLAGLRAGGFVATIAVGAALSAAVGSAIGCLGAIASFGAARLRSARAQQKASLREADAARLRAIEAGKQRFLTGGDLRTEVLEAQAAVEKLRAGLAKLEGVEADLIQKLEAEPAKSVAEELTRLRGEVAVKIDLGRRVLAAAEVAAFRLACFEPLRRLLRRRPEEATGLLSSAATLAELEGRLDLCTEAIKAFLDDVAGARADIDALEEKRPAKPSAPETSSDQSAAADPLSRARNELSAIEAAYRAVLERTDVIRLRLATRAGMEEVASAAGAVSDSARMSGLNEGELKKLVGEVARAESTMSISAPDGADLRALSDALSRSADALDREDTTSLDELLRAMREMD